MTIESELEYDKLYNKMLDSIFNYSNHLIQNRIKSTTLLLTNGFDITFRDRKIKRND